MKVVLYSRFGSYPAKIESLVKSYGLEIIDPGSLSGMTTIDAVICFGGDGTALGSERDYPEIPKLILKDSPTCRLCSNLPNEKLLELLVNKGLTQKNFMKLEANFAGKKLQALNEFVFRNKIATTALRLLVTINDETLELIGDGIVVATPFGSTGYFYSITRQTFTKNIGLAFNNLHNYLEKFRLLLENLKIRVKITRGPVDFTNDNNPEILQLNAGDEVIIRKSSQTAKILIP